MVQNISLDPEVKRWMEIEELQAKYQMIQKSRFEYRARVENGLMRNKAYHSLEGYIGIYQRSMLHLDDLNEVMALRWIKIDKKLEKKMEQIEQELKEKGVSLTTPMPEEIVLKISRYQEGKQQEQEAIQQKKQDELAHKERQQKHEQKVLQGLEKTQELKGQELKTLEEDLKALHEKAGSTWLRIQSFFGSSTATSKLSSYQRDIETC